jgi:hypothetical protein
LTGERREYLPRVVRTCRLHHLDHLFASGSMPIRSFAELLLASEVALGGPDRDVPKQELNLIQFAAG